MKRIWIVAYVAGLAVGLAASQARPQSPLDTAFTYQGQLKEGAIPANGIYDFQFHLYDASTNGTRIGSVIFDGELMQPHHYPPIHVANGLFTAELDFGADAFSGDARWLEIQVRLHPDSGDPRYTVLSPRQPLNAAPYALYALDGPGGAGGFWAANGADIYSTNSGKVGIGTTTPAVSLQVINEGGPDAIADWPILNALVNTSCGASWVSVHHGGGVGIGYAIHAGQVIVADGTKEAAARLQRVLTADPATGIIRHADAGYERAQRIAKQRGVKIP